KIVNRICDSICKKELDRNRVRASSQNSILHQLSSDSSNDDGGGGGKLDSHCTHCSIDSTKGHNHSIDMADSIRTGNSRIHTDSSYTRNLDNRTQFLRPRFRLTPERQNAARERKPIRLPSMRLREVFSL